MADQENENATSLSDSRWRLQNRRTSVVLCNSSGSACDL